LQKSKVLDIDVVEFNDFVLPNIALNEGSLDANSYQHQPFLDVQVKLIEALNWFPLVRLF
jgi:D-methionine transport system substrate-binding protein